MDGHVEFHFRIDLSVQDNLPKGRGKLVAALAGKGIAVHNASFTDQRKRRLQNLSREIGLPSLSASREGEPDELLIVKSDLNVAGGPERRTLRRFPGLQIPLMSARISEPWQYLSHTQRNRRRVLGRRCAAHREIRRELSRHRLLDSIYNRIRPPFLDETFIAHFAGGAAVSERSKGKSITKNSVPR